MADLKTIKTKGPNPPDPKNVELTKYYTFNQTGNIMISSTIDNAVIAEAALDEFQEVATFFAAMTKAMATTVNPSTVTKKNPTGDTYSLYNYNAIQSVVDGSGLFVHVQEEDITHTSESFGVAFSGELLEAALGLATGGAILEIAASMVSSLGKEGLRIHQNSSSSDSKVALIVFVCEYLLGVPMVSALVMYSDVSEFTQTLSIGPCFKESSTSSTITIHKDTYLFVTPETITKDSKLLDSVIGNAGEVELVSWLQDLLEHDPIVYGVFKQGVGGGTRIDAGDPIVAGSDYMIMGTFLPEGTPAKPVTLKFSQGSGATLKVTSSNSDSIGFSVSGVMQSPSGVEISYDGAIIGATPDSYAVHPSGPWVSGVGGVSGGVLDKGKPYTLLGLNLPPDATIKLGSAALTITSQSPTAIDFTAPKSAVSTGAVISVYDGAGTAIAKTTAKYTVK